MADGRFDYVKYEADAHTKQQVIKGKFEELEDLAMTNLVDGRAKSLFMTKLEEAYMWAGKAIRDEQIALNGNKADMPSRSNS